MSITFYFYFFTGVDAKGKGLIYTGVPDCFVKIWNAEGFLGFYKGIGASYFRLGPHIMLCLIFWEKLKQFQNDEHK
jgi:solute carrier family 25 protein 34/35